MTFLDWVSLRKKKIFFLMDWFISIAETTKAQGSWQKMGREWPSKPVRSELSGCNVLFPETACLIFDGIWEMWHPRTGLISAINTVNIVLCLRFLWKANFYFSLSLSHFLLSGKLLKLVRTKSNWSSVVLWQAASAPCAVHFGSMWVILDVPNWLTLC